MSRLRLLLLGALCLCFLALATWFFLDDPLERRVRPRPSGAPGSVAAPAPPPRLEVDAGGIAAPPPVAASRRIVRGRITDPDGNALVQARIESLVDGHRVIARSDVQGRFELRDLPRKVGRIDASATGHEAARRRLAADVELLDLTLERSAGLVVQVRHADQPVADAQVIAYFTGGRPVLTRRADGGGLAHFDWPDQGIERVTARSGAHGLATVEVAGPGRIAIDLPAGGYITGRVTDTHGEAVGGFSVTARARMLLDAPTQSFEAADGHYRYGPVAAGTLSLHAAAEGHQPGERSVTLREGETVSGVDFKLDASVRLVGQVFDSKTRAPIEGASVVPAEWRAGVLAEAVGTYTDAEGRYALSALPGTRTSVRVKAEGYRSVLIGGVEGPPGGEVRRDFGLTPQRRDQVPATELTGIGAVLAGHPKGVRIGRILEGPAAAALEQGDVVVAIDGEPIAGRDMAAAAQAIRGEEGTDVELMVLRGGQGDPVPVVITRGRVTVPDRHHGMQRN